MVYRISAMKKNGTIVNILFALFIIIYEFAFDAVYSSVTGDALEEAAREVIYGGKTDPLLGAIIVAAVIAEFIGIVLKRRNATALSESGVIFFLWMFHTVVTSIMVMTACKAFGADLENMGAAAGAAIFLNIIKELAILFILWSGTTARLSRTQSIAADACILFFYCTGFSTGWDVISSTPGSNLHQHLSNIPLLILYTILAMILFLMLYLPLRIGYFMTERMETNRDIFFNSLSIAAVTIAAMIPLFRPLNPVLPGIKGPAGVEIRREYRMQLTAPQGQAASGQKLMNGTDERKYTV